LCAVAFALHNVNLLTRATEPTPANHWQQAFKAAAMTTQQLQQIEFANQFCVPRLQQLQAQQQQLQEELAELSQSAGPGSGSGSGRQGQESPTAAAATATSPAPALNRTAAAPAGAAGMAAAVSMASQAVARLDVPMAPAGSDGPSGSTGSGGSLGGCSSRARQQLLAQAKQLEQRISSNFKAWMVLANMRAHYCSAVLTPVQMARLVTAAAPYLLIGAPM
jgi:hypothetical protein